MWGKKRIAFHVAALLLAATVMVGLFAFFTHEGYQVWRLESVVNQVIADRTEALTSNDGGEDFGSNDEINVLLLGLDARKGEVDPHCDAIHMFTLNIKDWTIHITSVPRGTYTYIPPGNYASTDYYLANACSYAGLDYGIQQIEKVAGRKADYYVTVGFSQVIAILRIFDMPTTESLQWLRHRQSYQIGDPQRSHNQALFIKDMITGQGDLFEARASTPLLYLLYTFVDTDMSFGTMQTLIGGFLHAKIYERPEAITLDMKPFYETVDYHLDLSNPDEQIQNLIMRVAPYLSGDDLSGKTLSDIQAELTTYLEAQLKISDGYIVVMEQALWRQVENDEVREDFHFRFLEQYVYAIYEENPQGAEDAISAYILEKNVLAEPEWQTKGEGLLAYIVSKQPQE